NNDNPTFLQTMGGDGTDQANATTVDASGNVYVAGQTASSGFTAGGSDFVLQKYNSSGVEQWTKTWGGDGSDIANAVTTDASGNVYVAGQTASSGFTAGVEDLVLQKYDSSGVEQWTKTWGGDGSDIANAVTTDTSGNVYVAGRTNSIGFMVGSDDLVLQKYDSSGVEQWTKTWGGISSDIANAVTTDTSGNVYVAGQTNSSDFTAGVEDLVLQKYDSSGVEQWTKTWGGDGNDKVNAVTVDASGNIYLAGYTASTGFTAGSFDLVLQKYNSSGVEQWTKTWGGTGIDVANAVTTDTSGNVYLAGSTASTGFTAGGTDLVLQKYDSSGVEQWTKTWGGDGSDIAKAVTLDSSGNIYLAGYTASTGFTAGGNDSVIAKFNSSGSIANCSSCVDRATAETDRATAETYRSPSILVHCGTVQEFGYSWGGPGSDVAFAVTTDTSGNIYMAGSTASTGFTAGVEDFVLQKYNSSGVEQWTKTWGGTGSDVANAVTTDTSGNVYLAGYTNSTGFTAGSNDFVLQKYDSSGVEQWTKTWGGTGTDNANALITDSRGNVYVVGSSTGFTAGSQDFLIIRTATETLLCAGVCVERTTSETDRATSETDRATSETDRATAETDRATSETDRATSETRRFESMPINRSFVGDAYNSVAQNSATSVTTSDVALRLYMALHATTKTTLASSQNLKLQYSPKSGTCDTSFSGESYTDVTTSTPIAFYTANNFTDGSLIEMRSSALTHSTDDIFGQGFFETAGITNPNATIVGKDYVWDLSVTPYEALNGSYCLRFVFGNNNLLNTYSQVAEIQFTAPSTRQHLRHGKSFDAETGTRQAFYW
ncbi:MAG: SBBP repeat-containing protein, partial [bacterium]|nr:SBBP repeat-containing protein [bacterium]